MICFYPETSFTLFFSIYVLIPLSQITQAVFSIFSFLLDPHRQPETTCFEEDPNNWELDLPVTQFQDLDLSNENDEMCSICLMDFEKDDLVNKLSKCGHVFHIGCLEKWLDTCQLTCPLCRCLVLRCCSSPPCKMGSSAFCINLPPEDDTN